MVGKRKGSVLSEEEAGQTIAISRKGQSWCIGVKISALRRCFCQAKWTVLIKCVISLCSAMLRLELIECLARTTNSTSICCRAIGSLKRAKKRSLWRRRIENRLATSTCPSQLTGLSRNAQISKFHARPTSSPSVNRPQARTSQFSRAQPQPLTKNQTTLRIKSGQNRAVK